MINLYVAPIGTSYDSLPGQGDFDPWIKVGSPQWNRFANGDLFLSNGPMFMLAVMIPSTE